MSITWDYVRAGESTELLPVAADLSGGLSRKELWRVTLTYTNHRQFAASTSVSFDMKDKTPQKRWRFCRWKMDRMVSGWSVNPEVLFASWIRLITQRVPRTGRYR